MPRTNSTFEPKVSLATDRFNAEHRRLETLIEEGNSLGANVESLAAKLLSESDFILQHLDAKDSFYVELAEICQANNDAAGKTIAGIFAQNMKVQSNSLRSFLKSLSSGKVPSTLANSFQTMATVLRSRISTEERAVFPIFLKHQKGIIHE